LQKFQPFGKKTDQTFSHAQAGPFKTFSAVYTRFFLFIGSVREPKSFIDGIGYPVGLINAFSRIFDCLVRYVAEQRHQVLLIKRIDMARCGIDLSAMNTTGSMYPQILTVRHPYQQVAAADPQKFRTGFLQRTGQDVLQHFGTYDQIKSFIGKRKRSNISLYAMHMGMIYPGHIQIKGRYTFVSFSQFEGNETVAASGFEYPGSIPGKHSQE